MKRHERILVVCKDNGLGEDDYSSEEISEWLSRTPAERFAFFLEMSNFFCSLVKYHRPDPDAFELENPLLKTHGKA